MDEKRKDKIQRKVAFLLARVGDLTEYLPATRSLYEQSKQAQSSVERECQVVVECAMDINVLIAQHLERQTPQTGREGFAALWRKGIVSSQLRDRFEKSYIGFRNLIVHVYDQIDSATAYYTAQRLIPDATQYAREIRRYLDSIEPPDESCELELDLTKSDADETD